MRVMKRKKTANKERAEKNRGKADWRNLGKRVGLI